MHKYYKHAYIIAHKYYNVYNSYLFVVHIIVNNRITAMSIII